MDWDNVDDLFSGMNQKAEQAAVGMAAFSKGQVPPEQLLNVFAQLVMAVLGPARLQALQKQMQGPAQLPSKAKGTRGDTAPLNTTAGTMPGGAP